MDPGVSITEVKKFINRYPSNLKLNDKLIYIFICKAMAKTKGNGKSKKNQAKRTFFAYSDDNMQKAIQAVRKDGLSRKNAAQQFGIPRSTLIRKLSGTVPLQRKMGPRSELSETEENTFGS
jgi:DNA-binding NtrC family response regulator